MRPPGQLTPFDRLELAFSTRERLAMFAGECHRCDQLVMLESNIGVMRCPICQGPLLTRWVRVTVRPVALH